MAYWEDQYLGIAVKGVKHELLNQILECVGADTGDSNPFYHCNPAYEDSVYKLDGMKWGNVKESKTGIIDWEDQGFGELDEYNDLLTVLVDLFPEVQICYVSDCGDNVGDSSFFGVHLRTVFSNEDNVIMCREDEASFADSEAGELVQHKNYYELVSRHVVLPWEELQNEIEMEARKEGIEISWEEFDEYNKPSEFEGIQPDHDNVEFSELCDRIFEDRYDYSPWILYEPSEFDFEAIAVDEETKRKKFNQIVCTANEKGYGELVSLLRQDAVELSNKSNTVSDTIENDSATINLKPTPNEIALRDCLKNGVEIVGTQYEGRNDRIERVKVGDKVKLVRDPDNKFDKDAIEVFNEEGSLGHISARAIYNGESTGTDSGIRPVLKDLATLIDNKGIEYEALVQSVTPLSQRSARCKNALISIAINIEF